MATPTVETKIWLALREHLEQLVLTPVVPILWPAETKAIPDGTSLEVTHLPNRPVRQYLGSDEPSYREGILQIGVLTVSGDPDHQNVATEIAGDVAAHFAADEPMTYAGVTVRAKEAGSIGASFSDVKRGRWVTPVSIRYHTEA